MIYILKGVTWISNDAAQTGKLYGSAIHFKTDPFDEVWYSSVCEMDSIHEGALLMDQPFFKIDDKICYL